MARHMSGSSHSRQAGKSRGTKRARVDRAPGSQQCRAHSAMAVHLQWPRQLGRLGGSGTAKEQQRGTQASQPQRSRQWMRPCRQAAAARCSQLSGQVVVTTVVTALCADGRVRCSLLAGCVVAGSGRCWLVVARAL